MTTCLMSPSVAFTCQPKSYIFGGPQGWKSLGPILPTGHVTGYVRLGRYGPTSLQSTFLCPVIFITFDPLPAQSKLLPGIRHLTPTASVSGYKPWVQVCQMLIYQRWLCGGLVHTICYNVPSIYQGQQKVLSIKVFVTQLFIFLCSFVLVLWMCGM